MQTKILVVSSTPWNTNNSFGNSYANIFDGLGDVEIANIYCTEGVVNDPVVKYAYRVNEKSMLKKLFGRSHAAGGLVPIVQTTGTGETYSDSEKKLIRFAKMARWQVLFWAQEFLWKIGGWNEPSLTQFIQEFAPDLVFVPVYGKVHMCRIDLAVYKIAGVPMFGYISDDNYTLRHFSLSPLWWVDRLYFRRLVKRVIDACDRLYVISDIQKQEYDKIFNKDCHILTKGGDFTQSRPPVKQPGQPIELMFAGNIGSNRWKSLAVLVQQLKKVNIGQTRIRLTIYTATPLTKRMERALNIPGSSVVAGRIPYCEVVKRQKQADVLVHVEATDMVYRWGSHQGFSTKLVDYMLAHRPILAYGLEDQASIAHLKQHNAALVATNPGQLCDLIQQLTEKPAILEEYAQRAWDCGSAHHDIHHFHQMLHQDFEQVIYENRTN